MSKPKEMGMGWVFGGRRSGLVQIILKLGLNKRDRLDLSLKYERSKAPSGGLSCRKIDRDGSRYRRMTVPTTRCPIDTPGPEFPSTRRYDRSVTRFEENLGVRVNYSVWSTATPFQKSNWRTSFMIRRVSCAFGLSDYTCTREK